MCETVPSLDSYRDLLRSLATLSPPLFMMGGFAEDALLSRRIIGQHADLDVLVQLPQLHELLQRLATLGFTLQTATVDVASRDPIIVKTCDDSPDIEIWVCSPERDEGYSLVVFGQSADKCFRVVLSADTFAYPATTIEGIQIQTVSPVTLYQLRDVSSRTRHVGERRMKDLAVMEQLRRAFLADRDERALTPGLFPY